MSRELGRNTSRTAAAAGFALFWGGLLVALGLPALPVVLLFAALVGGTALALGGRGAVAALRRRASGLPERLDGIRRTTATAAQRATRVAAAGARTGWKLGVAAGSAAAAAAEARTRGLRRELAEVGQRSALRQEALRLNEQAATHRQEGNLEVALEASERALELFRTLGDSRGEALTLNGIGLTQARSGDESGAIDSYEAAVAILTGLGETHAAGRVLANLGELHRGRGADDEARAVWHDALERLEPGSPEHDRTAQQLRLAG